VSLLVQKYGGSSLATIDHLADVADQIVESYRAGHNLVVVVSAMGETTDDLMARAERLSESPSQRELDMLLSVGERISMALLSIAIQDRGVESVSLTGSQCGIITTHNHSNAKIMDVRPYRVQDELAEDRIVIVAGYQGTSYKREVTTLGRGGSDTTAVALAGALGAEACEIYSDVDGIYSADPNEVLDARKLMELSHTEMLEIARGGAEVLHEEAVKFAREADIALYAKKTHGEDSDQTVIRPDGYIDRAEQTENGPPGRAISTIEEAELVDLTEFDSGLIDSLDTESLVFQNWLDDRTALLFDKSKGAGIRRKKLPPDSEIRDVAAVSVTGDNVGTSLEWVNEARNKLDSAGIETIHLHAEADRLTWAVPPSSREKAAELLHGLLVQSAD
jgi:aspartate kinase